ncbi:MAG: TIGR03668 family PPOX class F420-dependent oxidoreductase [Candidatus Binataceae bacterium]
MAAGSVQRLSEPRVREFLLAARVARLATADGSAAPHVVPLCFWFDGIRLYFAIDEKPKRGRGTALKRMQNIAANPQVAVVIDHYEEDWAQLAFVMIRGTASIVDDNEEYMLVLRNLRDKYRQYRAMALNPEGNPIVRINPERLNVWGARFGHYSGEPR